MSQISLQSSAGRRNEARVVLEGAMARHTVKAISDELSKRILVSVVSQGKTAQEISVEQALPLSSCYRRIRELVEQGLLVVERIVVTAEGKRFALYRGSFRSVEMAADFREVMVTAELNEEVANKFRLKWFCLAYP